MAEFLVVYHGSEGEGTSHEEKLARMDAWLKWMGSLGSAIKDAGHPTARAWTTSKDGTEENGGANPVAGYTVITADSMQAALDLVSSCPHIVGGNTIELCELSGGGHAALR